MEYRQHSARDRNCPVYRRNEKSARGMMGSSRNENTIRENAEIEEDKQKKENNGRHHIQNRHRECRLLLNLGIKWRVKKEVFH